MIELRPASADEAEAWQSGWYERQRAAYRAQGLDERDIESTLRQREQWRAKGATTTSRIMADADPVGFVAVSERDDGAEGRRGIVHDLWVAPEHRRRGHADAARNAVELRCRETGVDKLAVTLDPRDPAQHALFASYRITSQRMALTLAEPSPLPEGLVGRPMSPDEFVTWRAESVAGYAHDIAGSGAMSTADAMARSEREFTELLPDGVNTTDHSLSMLEAAGRPVASIWICHHHQVGRSFIYGVAVDAAERGKGYGRAVMQVGARVSLAAGDRVLALNVFGQNAVAINLYDSLGYEVTDQSRSLDLAGTE